MDHAAAMSVAERLGHITRDPDRFLDRQLPFALEALAQRLALDARHGVEQEAIRFTGIEERQDVGMVQPGGGLDFAEKSLPSPSRGQLAMQPLYRPPPA